MSLALHVTNKVPTSFPVISMDHLQYMFSLHKCMYMSHMKKISNVLNKHLFTWKYGSHRHTSNT